MIAVDTPSIRRAARVFTAGALITVISGVIVQTGIQPSTSISDDMWSYPWSSGALVAVSILYALVHVLVAIGLLGFSRSGIAGGSRAGHRGVTLALVGTVLLAVGELASISIRHAQIDDTSAGIVGAIFGLATVLSAVGFLLAGKATLSANLWHGWRALTPLVTGIWTTGLVVLASTKALPGGVAVYGLCLLAVAVALYTQPAPGAIGQARHLQRA